jgi:rhamnosyltransferase
MDDDTGLPVDAVKKMLRFVDEQPNTQQIGIISGIHSRPETTQIYRIVPYTMTSGNLLNLSAYQHIGPFLDALFIDHVDHEYGLRLNRGGYQVIELTDLHLKHQLGDRKKILGGIYTFVSHTPLRTYYIVRNGWVVARRFPEFRLRAAVLITKEWVKAIFFDDQKLFRLKMMWRGMADGWAERLGKLKG